jgi:hypothetical protein
VAATTNDLNKKDDILILGIRYKSARQSLKENLKLPLLFCEPFKIKKPVAVRERNPRSSPF